MKYQKIGEKNGIVCLRIKPVGILERLRVAWRVFRLPDKHGVYLVVNVGKNDYMKMLENRFDRS